MFHQCLSMSSTPTINLKSSLQLNLVVISAPSYWSVLQGVREITRVETSLLLMSLSTFQ